MPSNVTNLQTSMILQMSTPHARDSATDVHITTIFLMPAGTTYHNKRYTVGYNTRKRPSTDLCLCSQCASHFYNSPTHRILRADSLQVAQDFCDHSRTRRGYDFFISIVRPVKSASRIPLLANHLVLHSSTTHLFSFG